MCVLYTIAGFYIYDVSASCFTGKVLKVYGSGRPGLHDGEGTDAEFNTPQGLVYHEEALYVADTENHALRKVSGYFLVTVLMLDIY